MKRVALIILCFLCAASYATVNFPYPQAHPYGNNTIIANVWNCAGQTASSMLKAKFTQYLSDFYVENNNQARIKFDNADQTVSEGIGYGMIMMVYFSDNTTSYQSQFDKLWNYYQAHVNGNGLMNWKIDGFGGTASGGQNGATDADEDVAFALVMAYYQFGDTKYRTAAASLISKIRQKEFNSDGMHRVGDAWDPFKNPSYVSPAAYEVFKSLDDSQFWGKAISTNYTLLQNNAHSTTGIPTGWSSSNGSPVNGNNSFVAYDYDAARAPWRWAWSYAWYGHSQASTLLSKLATWVNSKSQGELKINMNQDGTCTRDDCESNGTSVGSLSSTLIYNSTYQQKLNENFVVLLSKNPGYYHSSLRLLTGLLMTGNMQNFSNNYTNQPYTFTMTPEMEESCKAEEIEYHQNSGAYGWNSTTVVLTDESVDGVHMGASIRGTTREVERELGEVVQGEKYTLSYTLTSGDYSSYIYAKVHLYSSTESKETDYCSASVNVKLLPNVETSVVCEFEAAESANPMLNISLNARDVPEVTLSNLKLVSASGEEIEAPEGILRGRTVATKARFAVVGKNVAYSGISGRAAINVLDLQGRVMLKRQVQGSGTIEMNGLRSGVYIVQLKGTGILQTKRIQIH